MTNKEVAKDAAMEQRVLAALRKHGAQPIYQLWARIALPEMQAVAEGARQEVTSCGDVAAAFWRLLEQRAVEFTPDRLITIAKDAKSS